MVFTLLETLYSAFDTIAKRRRVVSIREYCNRQHASNSFDHFLHMFLVQFKVETVGDCYVAVAGLPEPRKDHATAIARFAAEIVTKMHTLTKELEVLLGPDTGELGLRVG